MSAIQVQDLNPTETIITLNGVEYSLRKFDMLAKSWAHREFKTKNQPNGLFVLSEKLTNIGDDFETLLKCIWHLLKNKKMFGSFDGFCLAVTEEGKRRGSDIEVMGELFNALNYTLGVSNISESDIREDQTLKKLLGQGKLRKRLVLLVSMIGLLVGMAIVWRNFIL